MEVVKNITIKSLDDYNFSHKTVLLRLDINSPLDPKSKRIINENRIRASLPTISELLKQKTRMVIIAHQGDTLDYHNLIPLAEHAQKLAKHLQVPVRYIDDVAGPAAQNAIKKLNDGEIILLGNLRYLTEEVSSFEDVVKLEPRQMLDTFLVRNIAPYIDYYVNDAFAAAHRGAPSMVAFQEIVPSAGGRQLIAEISALMSIIEAPRRPAVFVLGGAKISDAFGMMKRVLENKIADFILTCGITGQVMLAALGRSLGEDFEQYIKERGLEGFVKLAKEHQESFPEKILVPSDLAYENQGKRVEIDISELPSERPVLDIGGKTISRYREIIKNAGTVFVNGPAGAYEMDPFSKGTQSIWQAVADTRGYSVIGGGDTVSAAERYIDCSKINYICTGGGAMVRFLSGTKLPLIEAMEKASSREYKLNSL